MLKKYKCIMQDDIKDCGVSCLSTIIETYGGWVSKEELRDMTRTNRNGVNAYYLLDAAKKIGFETKAVTGDILDVTRDMLPCIAHIIIDNKYKHFVVIHDIDHKKRKLVIADPSKGITKITFSEWEKISTKKYLIMIPNRKLPVMSYNNKVLNIILKTSLKYTKLLLTFFTLSLLLVLINILLSFKFKLIMDEAIIYESKSNLYFIVAILLSLVIIKMLLDYFRNNLLNFINHQLDYYLTTDVFNHILSLPYLYYKNRTTGEIITRINDLNDVKEFISRLFVSVFVDSILVIFVLITLFTISTKLTLVALGMVGLYLIILKIFNSILQKYVVEAKETSAIVNSHFVESFSGINTIKGMNLEETMYNKLDTKYNKYLNVSYKFNKIYNLERSLKEFVNDIGLLLILLIGSILVIDGDFSLSNLITYFSLITFFLEPIRNIINLDIVIKNEKVSLKRVLDIYQVPSENMQLDYKYTGNKLSGHIKINNLNYSYNGRDNILNNVNMEILPGQKIIIYGSSGSGKSTLAKILNKYIEINRNYISIDKRDINDYNNYELRSNICYISQDELIFTDSLYNNIVLNRDVTYDDFLKVCEITKTNEIIKDDIIGYNMLLEENGFNLSGGEKQRVFLARALLKKADIYIFDESLSQIDISKERAILINLFDYLQGKTIIMISHRFNNMDLFDQKILLEGENKNA